MENIRKHRIVKLVKSYIDNYKLMYMDTDSFTYELLCDDVYEDVIEAYLAEFAISDCSEDNIYNIPGVNKKVLGLMKDENNDKIMTHFVVLCSKIYSHKV